MYNAIEYNYGGAGSGSPSALAVYIGTSATGAGTVTLAYGQVGLSDGTNVAPLATTAPITIGAGSNAETVTPSAVSNSTPGVYGSATVTATFSNTHGSGDPIASGTFGLQEAINACSAAGGGVVIVDAKWAAAGGTNAMIAAATFPSGVGLLDNRTGGGGVLNYTVTIANAAVLTNNTVPTAVLPAPPATAMWDIIDMVVENKNTGVAYTGGGVMALYYGTTSAGVLASATIAATFLTSPTAAQVIKVAGALASTAGTSILGKGVVFTNPTADFAAGTGTVILKVSARLLTGL